MEPRACPWSRPLLRPPPPPATLVRRLRAGGVGVMALLVWAVAAPGFVPAGALASGVGPTGPTVGVAATGEPTAAEEARLRALAWQRGREAAAAATRDRAAAAEAAAGAGATSTPAAWVVPAGGGVVIPALTLRAYREAAAWAAGFDADCRLPWTVLAGIGRIESNHGLFGGPATRFSAGGTVSPRITGPPLNGNGVASIPDSDGGNGDGVADPNNLFDAAVAAAGYLCLSGGGSLADPARLRQAVYGYNHSWPYVDAVLGWARLYAGGVTTGPAVPSGPATTAAPTTAAPTTAGPTATTRRPTTTESPTSTTRRPTTTRPPSTTSPPTTTGPPTTGAPTTTTEPCRSTTTSTTGDGSTTTSSSTTTTTTTVGSTTTTTTTTLPCG